MQSGAGHGSRQGVLVAPDPSRSQYAIEVPWLIANDQEQSRALDSLEVGSLEALLSHRWEADLELHGASVDALGRIVEAPERVVFAQSVPSERIVSDIVESIGRYIGILDLNQSVSRFVYRYLENRCYGRQVALNEDSSVIHLVRSDSVDYIARYLSQELIQVLLSPTFIRVDISSTLPFTWTRDVPLIAAKKTVFHSVATVNKFERAFAVFLERCDDVECFASLAVADRYSLVIRGIDGARFSSILPCDPDWVVVNQVNGRMRYWIVSTKKRSYDETKKQEFMAIQWCKIATKHTGDRWRYIHVYPELKLSEIPSFHALIVRNVNRILTAFREAQDVPTSLEEMIKMRDEGRRSLNL